MHNTSHGQFKLQKCNIGDGTTYIRNNLHTIENHTTLDLGHWQFIEL